MSACSGPGCTHPDHRHDLPEWQRQHLPMADRLEELAEDMAELNGDSLERNRAALANALVGEHPPLRIVGPTDVPHLEGSRWQGARPILGTAHALSTATDRDGVAVKMLRTPHAVYVAPLGTPPPAPGEPLPAVWRDLGALAREAGVDPSTAGAAAGGKRLPNRAARRAAARGGRRRGRD